MTRQVRPGPARSRFVALVVGSVAALCAASVVGSCSGGGNDATLMNGVGAEPSTTLLIDRLMGPTPTSPLDPAASSTSTPVAVQVTPPMPSLGCGGGLAPGSDRIDFDSGGLSRFALRHRPRDYDGTQPTPLVIDLHAYTESAMVHAQFDGLSVTADRHAFMLVTPGGSGEAPIWNATRSRLVTDDVAFISDLVHRVEATDCVDTNRIFVTGLSNGALMASLLACDLSTQIAAVAPVAGVTVPADCAPTRQVPMIAFHGTADTFISYAGGTGVNGTALMNSPQSLAVFKSLDQRSIPDLMSDWARRNGCGPAATDQRVGTDVVVRRWSGCRADVELYTVDGGGHTWPGSRNYRAAPGIGSTTMTIDANELMWDFFSRHPLTGG